MVSFRFCVGDYNWSGHILPCGKGDVILQGISGQTQLKKT